MCKHLSLCLFCLLSLTAFATESPISYWMLMNPGKLDRTTWKRGERWWAGSEKQAQDKGYLNVLQNKPGLLELELKNEGSDCYYRSTKLVTLPLTDTLRFTGKLTASAPDNVSVSYGVLFRHPGINYLGNLLLTPTRKNGTERFFDVNLKTLLPKLIKDKKNLEKTTVAGWYIAIRTTFDDGKTFKDGAHVTVTYGIPQFIAP